MMEIRMTLLTTERLSRHCGAHTASLGRFRRFLITKICCFLWHVACRAQGVYFTLDAIYAIQEYGEGVHQLAHVPLWASQITPSRNRVCSTMTEPKQ